MSESSPSENPEALPTAGMGDPWTADRLTPLVYDALHELAVRALRHEGEGHTLQPTALVHEAYLVLSNQRVPEWKNRAHFFGIAARIMRRVLVDHARKRLASKRSGGLQVTFDEALMSDSGEAEAQGLNVIALEDALARLESLDERSARVVELRYYAGLDVVETARVLDISPASVKRDWSLARAFLKRELLAASNDG